MIFQLTLGDNKNMGTTTNDAFSVEFTVTLNLNSQRKYKNNHVTLDEISQLVTPLKIMNVPMIQLTY